MRKAIRATLHCLYSHHQFWRCLSKLNLLFCACVISWQDWSITCHTYCEVIFCTQTPLVCYFSYDRTTCVAPITSKLWIKPVWKGVRGLFGCHRPRLGSSPCHSRLWESGAPLRELYVRSSPLWRSSPVASSACWYFAFPFPSKRGLLGPAGSSSWADLSCSRRLAGLHLPLSTLVLRCSLTSVFPPLDQLASIRFLLMLSLVRFSFQRPVLSYAFSFFQGRPDALSRSYVIHFPPLQHLGDWQRQCRVFQTSSSSHFLTSRPHRFIFMPLLAARHQVEWHSQIHQF